MFQSACDHVSDGESLSFLSVGLAKLLFPEEAKVAMQIAQVDGTSEFTLTSFTSWNLSDVQRTTVDLNDAPYRIKEEHLNRHRALSKTGNELLTFSISCGLFSFYYFHKDVSLIRA